MVCGITAFLNGTLLAQEPTLRDGLVAYWPLDVLAGGKTVDLKNGYDLEALQLAAADVVDGRLIPGKTNKCFKFTANRKTLLKRVRTNAADKVPVAGGQSFTVSLWANLTGIGQAQKRIYAEGNTTTDVPLFNIATVTDTNANKNRVSLFIRNDANNARLNHAASAADAFDGENWHHVVYVQDKPAAGDATRQLYIDGQLDTNTFANRLEADVFSFNTIAIGGLLRGLPEGISHVDGLVDEVAVWDRALTASEVTSLHTSGLPELSPPPPPPLAIDRFEVDFPVVAAGRAARLNWRTNGDARILIDQGIGDVTAQSDGGLGARDVIVTAPTTFTITVTRGAEMLQSAVTVTPRPGVAAGWDLIDDFTDLTAGTLAGQREWVQGTGATAATVAQVVPNNVMRLSPALALAGHALRNYSLAEGKKATLFFRLCHTDAQADRGINMSVGLTEKTLRNVTTDFETNIGMYINFFREPGGVLTLRAKDGQDGALEDAEFTMQPGVVYNFWLDMTNNPLTGTPDTFAIYAAKEGEPRTYLYQRALTSDRFLDVANPLGTPGAVITSLVLFSRFTNQANEAMNFDDFCISAADTFASTVPMASAFVKDPVAPQLPFEIVKSEYFRATNELELTWNSQATRLYDIYSTSQFNIRSEEWTLVRTEIAAGTGATTTVRVPATPVSAPRLFYQIRIKP